MTIIDSINRSQSLVQEISSINSASEVGSLLLTLTKELTTLKAMAEQIQVNKQSEQTDHKAEMKSGCYIFTNEKAFYCPNCYDNEARKVATKRMNSKLRVCPSCRASIR
ncbi:MAG: hypothetical protein IMF04_02535 [Proteobacteria bacterium]|nr:hypothetical protein [Pseudomonadota bacterium]